jgi:LmbE family N-acetylglucosaminyl deacetylase
MTDSDVSRRDFVKQSLATMGPVVAASALPIPSALADPRTTPLKILCIGAHPDDPESGCGGTLARYSGAGHDVKILYLTRGERGIDGKSMEETAHIRTLEAEAACVVLGATPLFFGEIDGETQVTRVHVAAMSKLLMAEKPDIVFTHWPVDTHMDHQVASVLAIRGCMNLPATRVYFFEVNAGSQTGAFQPNVYVDITVGEEKKKAALFAHASQDGRGIWRVHHEPMAHWRGREMGVMAAEAFVRLGRGTISHEQLPGT